MLKALTEGAFLASPEELWRYAEAWRASGQGDEQADWMHEVAVDLIDIAALPEAPEPFVDPHMGGPRYETLTAEELRERLLEG